MNAVSRIGIPILVIGVAICAVCYALALGGSQKAPSQLQFFIPLYAAMLGAILTAFGLLRSARDRQSRGALIWSVTTQLGAETAIDQRRDLKTLPEPPLIGFLLLLVVIMIIAATMVTYPQARTLGALRERGVET